jgi:iron-sulfur cluster assembly accessory protein
VLVSVTTEADKHLSSIIKEENAIGIELGVKGGGCAGFTYEWDVLFDIPDQHDIILLKEGKLYIKKEAAMLLIDTTIDFTTGINGNYIVFKNPNATSQCGCGESFGI